MKVFCKTCGIHFPEEFERTLGKGCGFWSRSGLEILPKEDKVRLWNWLFAFNFDELFVRTGVSLESGFHRASTDSWESYFPGYPRLSEEEQRELQHLYYKLRRMPRWRYKLWMLPIRFQSFMFGRVIFGMSNQLLRKAYKES